MNLSDRGLKLIEGFEGYEKALPDGGCKSYRDKLNGKLDKWTIGFGCTEGVTADTLWTRAEADAAFRRELASHEQAVTQMVTVDLNQNEFDPLVSISYNIGSSALKNSTIVRKLNKGDRAGAAAAMLLWNRFGGKPLKALTSRRHAEAALFLEPIAGTEDDTAPQSPEVAPAPVSATTLATTSAVGGTTALEIAKNPPDLSAITAWQAIGDTVVSFMTWLLHNPGQVLVVAVIAGAVLLIPKLRGTPS